MGRWHSYWFTQGGRTSVALVRVALALAMAITLWQLGAGELTAAPASFDRPLGPWLALGVAPEPVVLGLRVVAWLATAALLLGCYARAAAAATLAAGLALAAAQIGATGSWAHHDSVPLVALAAFLGARGGDTLSVDAWRRRRRGHSPLVVRDGYQWSLRLVQIAVALAFASAAWAKLASGGGGALHWDLAASLRQQLATHAPPSPLGAWLLADPQRVELAATLDVVAELLPLGAVLLVRRPWLRLGFGSFVLVQAVAQGVVLGAWHLAWLPLAAVYVDWDRLIDWTADRVVKERAPSPPQLPYHHRVATSFIAVFLAADLALAFLYPQLDPAYRSDRRAPELPGPQRRQHRVERAERLPGPTLAAGDRFTPIA